MHPNIPASLSRCAPPFFCEHSTAECSRTLCVSRADGRLGRLPRLPRPDSLTKHAPAIFLAQRTSNFGAVCALNSVHALLWNPLHCKMLLLPFEGFASIVGRWWQRRQLWNRTMSGRADGYGGMPAVPATVLGLATGCASLPLAVLTGLLCRASREVCQ